MIKIICVKEEYQRDTTGVSSMIGDVNLFFTEDGTAEINIMIAGPTL